MEDNSCIICLMDEYNNEKCRDISTIPSINKKCSCIFYTHEDCIIKWINTNSICPFCKIPLNLEHKIIQIQPIDNNNNTSNENTVLIPVVDDISYINNMYIYSCVSRCVILVGLINFVLLINYYFF